MRIFLSSVCLFIAAIANCQITIAEARVLGPGNTVTIKGIITNGSELGPIRYIQDATAGTALYFPSITNSLLRGDSVQVTGTLVDFNNLLELNPISSSNVINTGNTSPVPVVLSPSQLSETYEGQLTRINNVTFAAGGNAFTGNQSYTFTNLQGESATIFVRNGSPLVGTTIPISGVNIIGLTSQFQSIYQLILRDANDIIPTASINIISSVSVSNISTSSFDLDWTTDIAGTTEVNYGLTTDLELGNYSDLAEGTNHAISLSNLEPGMIYYCQAYSVAGNDTAFAPIRPFGTQSLSSGDIKVYFNTSLDYSYATSEEAVLLYHSIDDTLISYINRAELTLDLTIYDFDNSNISNISEAINAAYDRGVRVRFISDAEQEPTNLGVLDLNPAIQRIISPLGSEYNIMHNKFVVIDALHEDPLKPIVWTGSTNWSDRQINRDNNNVVIIQDQTLAKTYTLEFEEMWGSNNEFADLVESKFGPYKLDNTPHEFVIGGKRVESYFSPSDATNNQLLEVISNADNNLYFASMLITRNDLAAAIVGANSSGIDVLGVIDDSLSTTQYSTLIGGLGYDRLKVNEDTTIIMHHKYLLADVNEINNDPTLWVGSHNWSNSANQRNDENTLVIHDDLITNLFYQEFMARFQQLPSDTATAPDLEAPIITCSPDLIEYIDAPANFTILSVTPPTATDNVSVLEITSDFSGTSEVSGMFFAGETLITYTAIDPSGNESTCTTSVTVVINLDVLAPIIECPSDIFVQVTSPDTSADVTVPAPSTSDNVGVITLINDFNSTSSASGTYPAGTTTVVFTASDAAGNSSTCSVDVVVEILQSISEEKNSNIQLYPNPSQDQITLVCPTGLDGFKVLDITGKVILEKRNTSATQTIDISNLSNGIYFVEVRQGRELKRIRFCKN